MQKRQFYAILSTLTVLGYLWIAFHYFLHSGSSDVTLCLFKNITSYPCPACGSSRSVLFILKGDFSSALLMNPLGFLLVLGLLILPFWLMNDWIKKNDSLFNFSKSLNKLSNYKVLVVLLVLLVCVNWIWNITKGL